MKTKNSFIAVFTASALILGGLTSCNTPNNQKANKKVEKTISQKKITKPDTLYLSKKDLNNKVQIRAQKEIQKQMSKFVKEAVVTLNQTGTALKDLQAKKIKAAQIALRTADKNVTVLLKKQPELGLVPVDVSVQTQDLVTGINQVNQITKLAKEAMNAGNYQAAAVLLNQLKSEVDLSVVNLPLGTFPQGIKLAEKQLNQKQTKLAEETLLGLLNSLEVNQVIMPIPVLKAQAFLSAAKQEFNMKTPNQKKVLNLLENADYQLQLAQAMGYGNFSAEYTSLSNGIKQIEKLVKSGKATPEHFKQIENKLNVFKNKIVQSKKK